MRQSFFTRGCLLFLFVITACSLYGQQEKSSSAEQYQCTPCGSDCDKDVYNEPGKCTHCGMALVKKSGVAFKNVQAAEICKYIKEHPNAVLLDVRTKNEYEGKADDYGTLQNAINIPIQELEGRLSQISNLKNKEIIVYCSHGVRSSRASYILTQNGFTSITNMAGGISAVSDKSCKK